MNQMDSSVVDIQISVKLRKCSCNEKHELKILIKEISGYKFTANIELYSVLLNYI